VCGRAIYRLLWSLFSGRDPSSDLLDLVRGNSFALLRADAQEELSRRKSFTHAAISPRVRSLCELVSGLEVLQRLGCTYTLSKTVRLANNTGFRALDGTFFGPKTGAALGILEFGSHVRQGTSLRLKKDLPSVAVSVCETPIGTSLDGNSTPMPPTRTAPPQLLRVQSYCLEADLQPCAASALEAMHLAVPRDIPAPKAGVNSSGRTFRLTAPGAPELQHALPEFKSFYPTPDAGPSTARRAEDILAVIEVAIAVAPASDDNEDEPPLYETVYCGSRLHFRQVGLAPSCSYLLRCRAAAGSTVTDWSVPVEFTTEPGISFTFDPLKCGPDIHLGEGNLKASYGGDDNWSTLLGSQPFSAGKAGWEIRVTHSSTAYLFVGVATSEADLNTFLGGCSNGWGFIGEQALYHSRENVKGYGEAFTAGDFIGVSLDFHLGTLSFSRNGKQLGVAFDKICGELYPAVAFYNVGQELEIIPEGFRASCAQAATHSSPARLNLHGKIWLILS
jgi:SPRY domain